MSNAVLKSVPEYWDKSQKGIIMSKVSSVDYPSYTGSTISINGKPKANVSVSGGSVNSNYLMNNNEQSVYDYAQSTLADILPELNVFSPDVLNSIKSQVGAFQSNGVDTINQIYSPMITSLQNDVASRFGNLDNSVFMDNLGEIEAKRSAAVSAFAQDVLAKQSELEGTELNKRYALVELLNTIQNQAYTNALGALNTATGSSSSANTYNNNLYNTLYKQSLANQTNANSLGSLFANLSGNPSFL